jgi:hypothetical protein
MTVSSQMLSIAENQWGLSGDSDSQAGKKRGRKDTFIDRPKAIFTDHSHVDDFIRQITKASNL